MSTTPFYARAPAVDDVLELLDDKWFGGAPSSVASDLSPEVSVLPLRSSSTTHGKPSRDGVGERRTGAGVNGVAGRSGATVRRGGGEPDGAVDGGAGRQVEAGAPAPGRSRFPIWGLSLLSSNRSSPQNLVDSPSPSPALGTWAGRLRVFGDAIRDQDRRVRGEDEEDDDDAGAATSASEASYTSYDEAAGAGSTGRPAARAALDDGVSRRPAAAEAPGRDGGPAPGPPGPLDANGIGAPGTDAGARAGGAEPDGGGRARGGRDGGRARGKGRGGRGRGAEGAGGGEPGAAAGGAVARGGGAAAGGGATVAVASGAGVGGARAPSGPAVLRPPQSPALPTSSDDAERHAAWRWRFTRKWQMEQAKQFDPEYGQDGNDDEWDKALGFMRHGMRVEDLPIARSSSAGGQSAQLASPSFNQGMLLEDSVREHEGLSRDDEGSMPATKELAAVAQKAAHLMRQQREIERQVEARWESASQPWVGSRLESVAVDDWGTYPFVLARLSDRSGEKRRLLVRGRNIAHEASLRASLLDEAAEAARSARLPSARVDILGVGTIRWAAKGLSGHVAARKLAAGGDALIRSKADVARITAALLRASLPPGYSVTSSEL